MDSVPQGRRGSGAGGRGAAPSHPKPPLLTLTWGRGGASGALWGLSQEGGAGERPPGRLPWQACP